MRFINQNGFSVILIIVGVLIIAAIGGAFFISRQNTPKPQTQNSGVIPAPQSSSSLIPSATDETANWKTYTNKKLGFSFNYPADYTLEKEGNDNVTFSSTFQPGSQVIPTVLVVNFTNTVDLKTLKKCQGTGFEENIKTFCLDGKIESKTFNGVKMSLFHIMTGSKNTQSSSDYMAQTTNEPKIEFIRHVLGGGTEASMDKILSTFKFTN